MAVANSALANSALVGPSPSGAPSVTTPGRSHVDSPLSANTTPVATSTPLDGGSSSNSSASRNAFLHVACLPSYGHPD